MPITLNTKQMQWLEAEVAAGRYASVETAAQSIIGEHIRQVTGDASWAAGLIDQVRSRIAQGDPDTLAQFAAFVTSRDAKHSA